MDEQILKIQPVLDEAGLDRSSYFFDPGANERMLRIGFFGNVNSAVANAAAAYDALFAKEEALGFQVGSYSAWSLYVEFDDLTNEAG